MRLSFRSVIFNGVLIFITCLTSLYILKPKTHKLNYVMEQNAPDTDMEEVVATMISSSGTPSLKIETKRLIHYPKNDSSYLIKPHVTLFRQTLTPWYIDANYAQSFFGVKKIIFQNNVIIKHSQDHANPAMTMETPSLTVFPHEQIAETIEIVKIMQPDLVIRAKGMLANLHDDTMKLLSKAQGEYEPHS